MNPPFAGSVFYESRFPRWLDELTTRLDYFWFVALLLWTLVLVLWGWHGRRKMSAASPWAWLPWSAGAAVLAAAVEFFLLNSDSSNPARNTGLAGNLALGLLPMLAAAGWWWQASAGRGRRWRLAAALSVLPLAALGLLRYHDPLLFSWSVAGAALVAAGPWLGRVGADGWSRAAVLLCALTPLFSGVGPLAIQWQLSGKTVPQTAGMLGAGAFQALAGAVTLAGLVREVRRDLPAAARGALWREARPFALGAALWSAGLLVFGALATEQQHEASLRLAFEQVQRVVLQLDSRLLGRVLGPSFQLDPASLPPAGAASAPVRLAVAPHLADGAGAPLGRVLTDVGSAARGGLYGVSIVTLRDGWLVVALSNLRLGPPGQVRLARPAGAQDRVAWERREEYAELAVGGNNRGFDFFRVPLTGDDGAMLGWLEFAQMRGGSAQMRARTTPFLGTVLGVVVAVLFVAQRRSLQEREAALREAAVATETARLRTDFLAKVSHELRTPLQNILGYGELIQADVAGANGRTRLAALRRNAGFMLRLVDDLLDLGAIEAGGFRFIAKPTALAALVRETVAGLRPRAEEKGLALACEVAPDFPPWVAIDGARFRQILLNLAGNAVKFTERGRVTVALRASGHAAAGGCTIELDVSDTGPGIAPAEQARLFQPFARLAPAQEKEGTGLGLALSAALCRSQGGALTVESDGRSGACFRARLPVRLAPAPAGGPAPADRLPSLRGRRILVADDNALVGDLFATWLADLGAVCETARDGEQALALADARTFDAVVLDLAMPRRDGVDVARRLRERAAAVRIVGVSAHASGADRVRALDAGMDEFLVKPVERAVLAAALAAGDAPKIPATRLAGLRAEFAARFRAGAAAEGAAVRDACARRDWPGLLRRVHHLKGSAGVVGDERLYAACGALEDAAEARDAAAAEAAWRECEAALAPWLG